MAERSGGEPGFRPRRLLVPALVGVALWLLPGPAEVDPRAWRLLAIFVAAIAGIILQPLPMGAVALLAMTACVVTGTLTIDQALAGIGAPVVWLVVAAFFVASAFIQTGLGTRIAYHFLRVLGTHTLGLAYGLIATDLVLAPAIPSNTARGGGVVFPILRSLCAVLHRNEEAEPGHDVPGFLTLTAYQGTVVTSAMFMTAMAANALIVELAGQQGVAISWTQWAVAGLVPGLVSLLVAPLLIFRLYPVQDRRTPEAPELARRRLRELGPMTRPERILLGVFFLLLALWVAGPRVGVDTTTAALIGVAILLLTGTLSWRDALRETSAWDTLVWFAVLVMMASQLSELGLMRWFGERVASVMAEDRWMVSFLALCLIYFYTHYFFASNTAHVAAMFAPFLATALAVGTPPLLAGLVLTFFSSLFACLTHYGTASAPVFFGSGNVELGIWWRLGALLSVVHIVIWLGIGSLWWKLIGVW